MHTDRVARGACWLDKQDPAWYEKVNPRTIQPCSDTRCVIGQVYGSYSERITKRWCGFTAPRSALLAGLILLIYPPLWAQLAFTYSHGFGDFKSLRHWRAAWEREIETRKASRTV